jgi:hypothetical protein
VQVVVGLPVQVGIVGESDRHTRFGVLLDHDREDERSGRTCPHERDARSLRRVHKRAGRDGPVRRQRGRRELGIYAREVCFLAVIARRGIDPAGDVPDRPPRPVDDISRVDHVFCGRIEAGNRPRGRTWLEADRLSLLSVKSPCPLLKLPELPVEQSVAPLVPRDLALNDRLLAGELASWRAGGAASPSGQARSRRR